MGSVNTKFILIIARFLPPNVVRIEKETVGGNDCYIKQMICSTKFASFIFN